MKQVSSYAIVWCISFAIIIFSPSTILSNETFNLGFGDSQIVSIVKNGHLNEYPQKTLGQAIDGFIGNARWTSVTATDGNEYVNIKGSITYEGKPAEVILQYKVDTSTGAFEFNAMEINGQPQNMLMYLAIIQKMYQ